jgi:site-specific recombinase XerD
LFGEKCGLVAIRHLFDWLVTDQVIDVNPAQAMRGPKYVVQQGKASVLTPRKPASYSTAFRW